MSPEERIILEKITKRGGTGFSIYEDDDVQYRRNGSFTICIIYTRDGRVLAVGATKRHPKDPDKPSLAQNIAFVRAVRDRGE